MLKHFLRSNIHRALSLTLVGLFFGLPTPIQAQITNPAINGPLGTDTAGATEGTLFLSYFITLWQGLITMGALAVIVYMIWGASEWIYAGGDSGKIQKARDKMTQAVIGIVVLAATIAIFSLVQTFLGVELINLGGGSKGALDAGFSAGRTR